MIRHHFAATSGSCLVRKGACLLWGTWRREAHADPWIVMHDAREARLSLASWQLSRAPGAAVQEQVIKLLGQERAKGMARLRFQAGGRGGWPRGSRRVPTCCSTSSGRGYCLLVCLCTLCLSLDRTGQGSGWHNAVFQEDQRLPCWCACAGAGVRAGGLAACGGAAAERAQGAVQALQGAAGGGSLCCGC